MAKRVILELLESPTLISRKIWVIGKSWNFHTVCTYLSKNSIIMGSNKVMLAPMAVAVGGCVRSWPLKFRVQMVLIIVMLMLTTTVSTTLRRCTMSAWTGWRGLFFASQGGRGHPFPGWGRKLIPDATSVVWTGHWRIGWMAWFSSLEVRRSWRSPRGWCWG